VELIIALAQVPAEPFPVVGKVILIEGSTANMALIIGVTSLRYELPLVAVFPYSFGDHGSLAIFQIFIL